MQAELFGHVMRKGSVERLAITAGLMADVAGDGQGTRTSGRSLKRRVDQTARDVDVITATADREMWPRTVSNARTGQGP